MSSSKKRKTGGDGVAGLSPTSILEPKAKIELSRPEKLEFHCSMPAKIAPFCPTILISVGSSKQIFTVPRDLLTLHSGYFKELFASPREDEDEKIALPLLSPMDFGNFVSWIYIGRTLSAATASATRFWVVGEFLSAPAFQNWCIDIYRNKLLLAANRSPHRDNVRLAYEKSGKGSKLRKFLAHCSARLGPLESHAEGSDQHTAWKVLFQEFPDLTYDIAAIAGKDWKGTMPWDDEHRALYVEDEIPLENQWESQILLARDKDAIKEAASTGCVCSIIELDHLERNKGKEAVS
ncbi:uncharacterized protein LY89DRAFT_631082 [Mollisia scopiformis]|uniref:BTB domain-containing protein n=1 Tax=Mollisia scopiformis TaxID=149040 RepID=A0A132B551_MOLSC|nr:uncharacterized protein LY89DRAFT_631082 [Mollisia scopiformis]KUJ07535.1 hypothetical protein LY89DRAFT_631082 [Mollisia scopiformis]